MRELTPNEQEVLAKRRRDLEPFVASRMPCMAELASALGLSEPKLIVADPERYLPSIHAFLKEFETADANRVWFLMRLGYYIGELLISRMGGGGWFINERPDSRTFLRYVVGRFPQAALSTAMVDPFEVGDSFLSSKRPRALSRMVGEIEAELRKPPSPLTQ